MLLREVCLIPVASPPKRAQGMPGARCAPRSRVQDGVGGAHEHTGHTGFTRHSPRNGFTAYFVLSPANRAFLPPSPLRSFRFFRNLTPASECQDHTTSPSASGALVLSAIRVHRIPPRVDDVGQRPLVGRDGEVYRVICDSVKQKYFSKWGLTHPRQNDPTGKSLRCHSGARRSIEL